MDTVTVKSKQKEDKNKKRQKSVHLGKGNPFIGNTFVCIYAFEPSSFAHQHRAFSEQRVKLHTPCIEAVFWNSLQSAYSCQQWSEFMHQT